MYRASLEGLLAAARTPIFLTNMRDSYQSAIAEHESSTVSLDDVVNAGVVHAATITYLWEFQEAAQSFAYDWICSGTATYTRFGRAFDPAAPLLGDTALAASLAQIYTVERKVRDTGVLSSRMQATGAFTLACAPAARQCRWRAILWRVALAGLGPHGCALHARLPVLCAAAGPIHCRHWLAAPQLRPRRAQQEWLRPHDVPERELPCIPDPMPGRYVR